MKRFSFLRSLLCSCLCCVLLLTFSACNSEQGVTVWMPYEGEKTVAGEALPADEVAYWSYLDYPRRPKACYEVSFDEQGRALVSVADDASTAEVLLLNGGYFLGVAMYDEGWVRYCPHGEHGAGTLVLERACHGSLKYDLDSGLLFVGETFFVLNGSEPVQDGGAICLARSDGTLEQVASLPMPAEAYGFGEDGETVYLVASGTVYRLSRDLMLDPLVHNDALGGMFACSVAERDGHLYIGTAGGFVVYDMTEKDLLWYPVETFDDSAEALAWRPD